MTARRTTLVIAVMSTLVVFATSVHDEPSVRPQAPAVPAPRWGHAMTYDSDRRVVLMFAGTADRRAPLRDFWAWDGHQWTLLPNDSGPSARDAAILVYDTKRHRAVLYGGRSPNGTALHDTWEWDGIRWTQRDTIGPGARVHAVGGYDPERSQVLVYGGVSPRDEFLSDTWMWDGQRWSESEKSQPVVRVPSGMAFDPASRRVVMLAHPRDSAGSFTAAELLEWTGRSWSPLSATRITT